MKAIFGMLAVALCAIPFEQAPAAACREALLDGTRTLTENCHGSCGAYQVDAAMTIDLGFGNALPDTISFEFYAPGSAATPDTGVFSLSSAKNANYATCEQCILVFQDENVSGTAQKTFFQTGGTIAIDAATVPGTAPDVALTWTNVTLAEVTLDPVTFTSTLVPNGDCYTIVVDRIFNSSFE